MHCFFYMLAVWVVYKQKNKHFKKRCLFFVGRFWGCVYRILPLFRGCSNHQNRPTKPFQTLHYFIYGDEGSRTPVRKTSLRAFYVCRLCFSLTRRTSTIKLSFCERNKFPKMIILRWSFGSLMIWHPIPHLRRSG